MAIYNENKSGKIFYNANLAWEQCRIKPHNVCNEIFHKLSLMGIKR